VGNHGRPTIPEAPSLDSQPALASGGSAPHVGEIRIFGQYIQEDESVNAGGEMDSSIDVTVDVPTDRTPRDGEGAGMGVHTGGISGGPWDEDFSFSYL